MGNLLDKGIPPFVRGPVKQKPIASKTSLKYGTYESDGHVNWPDERIVATSALHVREKWNRKRKRVILLFYFILLYFTLIWGVGMGYLNSDLKRLNFLERR